MLAEAPRGSHRLQDLQLLLPGCLEAEPQAARPSVVVSSEDSLGRGRFLRLLFFFFFLFTFLLKAQLDL